MSRKLCHTFSRCHALLWRGIVCLFLLSCVRQEGAKGYGSDLFSGMDRRTKLRTQNYFVKGHRLYLTHCARCHQRSGEGLRQWIPPLKNADYLLEDRKRVICVIKNGQDTAIWVNGRRYESYMPGFPQLSSLEIAELITYITHAWGHQQGLFSVREVRKYEDSCRRVR